MSTLKMAIDSMVDDESEGPRVILGPLSLDAFRKAIEAALIKKLAAGVGVEPSSIVLDGVGDGKRYNTERLQTAIAAARAQENERCAALLDASADNQEAAWKEHIASNKNAHATSLHAIPRGYAQEIRALIGATNEQH